MAILLGGPQTSAGTNTHQADFPWRAYGGDEQNARPRRRRVSMTTRLQSSDPATTRVRRIGPKEARTAGQFEHPAQSGTKVGYLDVCSSQQQSSYVSRRYFLYGPEWWSWQRRYSCPVILRVSPNRASVPLSLPACAPKKKSSSRFHGMGNLISSTLLQPQSLPRLTFLHFLPRPSSSSVLYQQQMSSSSL